MKQELISTGLALADFVHRHPKRISAVIAALLLGGGGGAFAVASLAPTAPTDPVRLVAEPVSPLSLSEQTELLDLHAFSLYRTDVTRAADTPESLLKRMGLADPAAAAFLRTNDTARKTLFGKNAGRTVTAEASDQQGLIQLRTQWIENSTDDQFKRLVVENTASGFTARVETAPLVATQRLVSGVIQTTLFSATDDAQVPDVITRQLTEMFDSNVDFHRGLRKGDRFSIVYEALEADGEPMRAGRILSAEFVNRGKTIQAVWFQEQGSKGGYYAFDGQSLQKAYLVAPLKVSRMTSGFGMRTHPVLAYQREHKGVDYAAPVGTPVRVIGDGVVDFAGVQNGYGKVIYVKHRNNDSSVYAHLSQIEVKKGDNVMQGETIGAVGMTGMTTGPHLHFEYRVNNEPQDPSVLAEQRENVPISPGSKAAFAKIAAGMKIQLAAAGSISSASAE